MKKLIYGVLISLFASFGHCDYATWEPSACADGYNLFYKAEGEQPNVIDVGNVIKYDIDPLNLDKCKRYDFYVTAYKMENGVQTVESDISNIAVYVDPIDPPTNVRIEYSVPSI